MGINLSCIEFIFDKKHVKNKNIIFIGDHKISFDKFPDDFLKKLNLENSINIELKKAKKDADSQRKFLTQLFNRFGYENLFYLENFEAKNIDYIIDLSIKDSSSKVNQKFGIVIDNGTSIYASNVINSLENVFNLTDINGFLLTNLDPMSFNRFPMQPSPESLLDIMTYHGLKTEIFVQQNFRNKLSKRKKYNLNYYIKHKPITEYLTINQFFFHILYLIKNFISFKRDKDKIIFSSDYLDLKKINFRELKNISQIKKIEQKKIKKLNWKNNFFFRFLKGIYNKMNIFIESRGRVVLIFEAEKIDLNPQFKLNSSTIFYTISNDK